MPRESSRPTPEEFESTYRILVGMALRKRFLSEQDREDFIQDVMLSALRSHDAKHEGGLSHKNLACGPAFRRAYQSYWRRFYRRMSPMPVPERDGRVEVEEVCDQDTDGPTDYLLMHRLLEEIDSLEEPLSDDGNNYVYVAARDNHLYEFRYDPTK